MFNMTNKCNIVFRIPRPMSIQKSSSVSCVHFELFKCFNYVLWIAFKVVSSYKLLSSVSMSIEKKVALTGGLKLQSVGTFRSGRRGLWSPDHIRSDQITSASICRTTLDQRPSPPSLLWSRRQSLWRFDSETALWVVSDSVRTIRAFHLFRSIDDEAEMRYDTMRCDARGNVGWMVVDVDEEQRRRGDRRRRRRP